ncbi:MAG: hypothetical protein O2931_11565 [Planctomycetota bacterium]|nr:hypothetical protein [Planctomycetota bacterium]
MVAKLAAVATLVVLLLHQAADASPAVALMLHQAVAASLAVALKLHQAVDASPAVVVLLNAARRNAVLGCSTVFVRCDANPAAAFQHA